jgi:hypothetical protein
MENLRKTRFLLGMFTPEEEIIREFLLSDYYQNLNEIYYNKDIYKYAKIYLKENPHNRKYFNAKTFVKYFNDFSRSI